MVNPDVRRLQILNDLIAQTLDAINTRAAVTGIGLSHTPWTGDVAMQQAMNPFLAQQYAQSAMGYGQVPYGWANTAYNTPYATTHGLPYAGGLSHSPFVAQGIGPVGVPFTDPRVHGIYGAYGVGMNPYRTSPFGW